VKLANGTRLGPYEILSLLGAGGMGEVYQARDTRLDRIVAVKVLPETLAASSEVRQRFEREAKAISRLSHPHICALYDVGREGETEYLVMEFLEGETLSERLARGSLSLEQTLRYGSEIADALDKAHRKGIVHRDLKPGNVMLTKTGVKLLDFGLAKTLVPEAPPGSLTAAPTAARDVTEAGTILGTLSYMAPEQLEGREADARTDVFALGAVLYEMATGGTAFSGTSQANLISSIMTSEPAAISTIRPASPPALDRIVRTCLAKDPEERWQSAGDLSRELGWLAQGSGEAAPPAVGSLRGRERLAWVLAAVLGVSLGAAIFLRSPRPASGSSPRIEFGLPLPEAVLYGEVPPVNTSFALSPDGGTLAFLGVASGMSRIYLSPLDGDRSRPLPDTGGAVSPFWSPDGRSIAFFADGKLKRIEVSGGSAITICEAPNAGSGTWSSNGTILFSTWGLSGHQHVLLRVSASGGAVTEATSLDAKRNENGHSWPTFLPDGKHFLFLSDEGDGWPKTPREIRMGELGSMTTRAVTRAQSRFEYSPAGYLLFSRDGALLAQALDASRGSLTGEPMPVASVVSTYAPTADADFSVARHAPVVAFREPPLSHLHWLDRSGRDLGPVRGDGAFTAPRFSPEGGRLAFPQVDPHLGTADIFIQDLKRETTTRVTFDPTSEWSPVWLPDGRHLIFASDEGGEIPDIYQLDLSDLRKGLLLHTEGVKYPEDVSADGRFLLYTEWVTKRSVIWVLPLTGDEKPSPFTGDPFDVYSPRFSPDGGAVAYVAEEAGRPEVYLRPFPGPGEAWQVSRSGGKAPRWSRDGREIFFVSEHALMSAAVRSGTRLETAAPVPLFPAELFAVGDRIDFEVGPEGRFLVVEPAGGRRDSGIHVIANWLSGLRR
jgi:serine/threonine protein kinase